MSKSLFNKNFLLTFFFYFFTLLLGYIFYTNINSKLKPLQQNKDITIKSTPLVNYVFLFMLDGVRYDSILDSNNAPFINKLIKENLLLTNNYVNFPSGTQQGIVALIAGCKPGTFSWMIFNTYREKVPVESLIDNCKERNIPVFFLVNKPWWNEFFPEGENLNVLGTYFENKKIIMEKNLKTVEKLNKYKKAFIIVHLEVSDFMGHVHGGNSKEYSSAIKLEDEIINETINSLKENNLLKNTTIIITSDHGHLDRGGHGGQENVILHTPLIFAGKKIKKGTINEETNILDIAPTIAFILGTNIPSYSYGKILYDIFEDNFLQQRRIAQYNLYLMERDYNQLKSEFNFKNDEMKHLLDTALENFNNKEYNSSIKKTNMAIRKLQEIRKKLITEKNKKNMTIRSIIILLFITLIICYLIKHKKSFINITYLIAILTGSISIIFTLYLVNTNKCTFSCISRSYPYIIIIVIILSLLDGAILWYLKNSPENILKIYILKSLLYIIAFIPYFIIIGPGIWPSYINNNSSLIIFSLLMLLYPFRGSFHILTFFYSKVFSIVTEPVLTF